MPEPTLSIEVTDEAKERLRAALARETRARFIRVDVSPG